MRLGLFALLIVVHAGFLSAQAVDVARSATDDGSRDLLGRVVTLDIRSMPLSAAIDLLSKRASVVISYSRETLPTGKPVSFSGERVPLADALRTVLRGTGVGAQLDPSGRRILLVREQSAARTRVQAGMVVGRVTDAKTGSGLSGVDIALEGTRWRTLTGSDGGYRLAEVALGSYTLLVRRIGYAPERRAVTVSARQETPVDVALQPTATRLGDVVVTAQKREERLQDVPLSIAVVTPEEIDRRALVSAGDYLRGIPGVNQVESGGLGGQAIIIRGLETSTGFQNFGTGPTTATYFGEAPITNSAGLLGANVDIKLADIERVEVLRGPQGTAFGNSSMGGAVRTIPVAPNLDRFEGKLSAGYSSTSGTGGDNYSIQGVGNFPLIKDKLALRATGYRYEESGFYRNRAGSDPTFHAATVIPYGAQAFAIDQEEVGASRFTGGRIAALFQAGDKLKFTLSYLLQETERDGAAGATSGTYEQAVLQVAPEHVRRGQRGGLADTDIDLANAVMEYDLGWASLLATYSYLKGAATEALSSNATSGAARATSSLASTDHREHAGEIRLATQFDGAWNFLAGLYAEDLEDEYYTDNFWHGDPATNFFPGAAGLRFLGAYLDRRNLMQKAAFGEVSWEFLSGLTLTGGARAYDYDRTVRTDQGGGAIYPERPSTRHDTDASGTTFRTNLSYKPDDGALLYAGWAQGFRLGKPQPSVPAALCDPDGDGVIDGTSITVESTGRVHSDAVDSYELGGKFALLNRRLMIDAALFRMDWSDIPVGVNPRVINPSACLWGFIQNAGAALSEGIEFHANVHVTEAFRVDVGGSWIRARLTEDAPGINAFKGDRLPGSPEVNASLGLQYEFKLGGSPAFVRADPIYIGPFYSAIVSESAAALRVGAGGYVKVDASARVAIRNTNIDLFVRNLTNAADFTFGGHNPANPFFGYRLRPRTIGLQLSRAL